MKVDEDTLSQVVAEASNRIADPRYVSRLVDELRHGQPNVTQYVIAHQEELQLEGVVTTLFHAALISKGIHLATGSTPRQVGFDVLNEAATSTPDAERLAQDEPNIASYIVSNVDLDGGDALNAVAVKILTHVAKAMLSA